MPFCGACGKELAAGALYCGSCGRPVSPQPQTATSPVQQQAPAAPPNYAASFAPWHGAVVLRAGEEVRQYWDADHETEQMGVVNGQSQMVKARQRGMLVLTSQRVVFVKQRGIFGKSYHVDLDFALENLDGVSMGGLVMKYVSITAQGVESIFHVRGVRNEGEFAAFRDAVLAQVGRRQEAIEAEKRRERVHIMLDFGFLREYMSKGGLSLQVVKCPQCGASISLPAQGSQTKCDHCGSVIFAQDIMEKVKQLIG